MSKESISKIYLILEKITYIEKIVADEKSITNTLNGVVTSRPAILMHMTAIAHEYEGVNIAIVEWIIRNGLPKFKRQCLKLIEEFDIK